MHLLLPFLLLGLQPAAVPHDAVELSIWLEQDPTTGKTWRALRELRGSGDERVRDVLREHLLARVAPEALEAELARSPGLTTAVLPLLSTSVGSERVADYVVSLCRARTNRLGERGGPWSNDELRSILMLQFLEPERFVADEGFRAAVLGYLPRALGERAPPELRDQLLFSINNVPGVDFEASEDIEWGFGAIPRRSGPREASFASGALRFPDRTSEPIVASIYSLPSRFFNAEEAARFLERVREIAPERQVLALVDLPLRPDLLEAARRLNVHLLETHGRGYSAWPRDPLSLTRDSEGRVVAILRPNRQRGRPEDNDLGRELVQGLPENLDRAWGGLRWVRSPVPFHNGQVLLGEGRAWVSLHSLEPHVLGNLGLSRVPVEDFASPEGWLRYVEALRRAAEELSNLLGREVTFVHDLPEEGELSGTIAALGGGAGYDLDSLVTMLPSDDGEPGALVADVDEGRLLVEESTLADLAELRRTFHLDAEGEALRERLAAALRTERVLALDAFLELVTRSLVQRGLPVRRLPLLSVPVALLRNRSEFHHPTFLIGWNNVVLDRRGGSLRAEGFRQGLPGGDVRAARAFRAFGYELDLIPPLVRSIVLEGGYRCASQHLR